MVVHYEIANGEALVTLDSPPLNVIGRQLRQDLLAALIAIRDAGVARVIVTGAGRAFAAGADAKEFGFPATPPHLPDVLAVLETLPAVAAINGAALGGGLEIALACRARIAAPGAQVGLPEVTLGVVPGAGGSQRLPRLTGLTAALQMISEGRVMSAAEAERLGIVDMVAVDPVEAARGLSEDWFGRSPVRDLPPPSENPNAVAAALTAVRKKSKGQNAPEMAVGLVANATCMGFDDACRAERTAFLSLRESCQAAALRHVFFAERAAIGLGKSGPGAPTEIEQAIVVGGGTMGAGIAYALAGRGIRVAVVETNEASCGRAELRIAVLYADSVQRGKTTVEKADAERAERISVQVGYDRLPKAQIAIEAAFEDIGVKRDIFRMLEMAVPPDTILATNTSYLNIDWIAGAVADPGRVLGMHFFSPAYLMRLVEVIPAATTTLDATATALRLAARLGKIPVMSGICDGFIGNRILMRYRQVADTLLLDGCQPWDIDAAMRGFGMAMGPYETQDLSGLDIGHSARKRLNWAERSDVRYVPVADRLVEEDGRLGRKTGAGWYDYAGSKATPSDHVEMRVRAASDDAGVTRRSLSADEISDRLVTAIIAEGFAILDEGITAQSSDIDLVEVHGYGFPRWRGGPMFYAETIGRDALRARISQFAVEDPVTWAGPNIPAD
jgi:3-hydroxyacyl-CoA dehydrogenase